MKPLHFVSAALLILFCRPAAAEELREDTRLQYVLHVPEGWNDFILGVTRSTADSLYYWRDDPTTREFVKQNRSDHVVFGGGEVVSCTNFSQGSCLARMKDGRVGWVREEFLTVSPESEKAVKREDAEVLARKEAADREFYSKRAREYAQQIAFEARCRELFEKTANKKLSELTVLESQNVTACTAAGLFHK